MGRARRQVKQEPPAVLRGLGRACTQKHTDGVVSPRFPAHHPATHVARTNATPSGTPPTARCPAWTARTGLDARGQPVVLRACWCGCWPRLLHFEGWSCAVGATEQGWGDGEAVRVPQERLVPLGHRRGAGAASTAGWSRRWCRRSGSLLVPEGRFHEGLLHALATEVGPRSDRWRCWPIGVVAAACQALPGRRRKVASLCEA